MIVAFLVSCPKCDKLWHALVDKNPCYDTCPHCKTEFEITVNVTLKMISTKVKNE